MDWKSFTLKQTAIGGDVLLKIPKNRLEMKCPPQFLKKLIFDDWKLKLKRCLMIVLRAFLMQFPMHTQCISEHKVRTIYLEQGWDYHWNSFFMIIIDDTAKGGLTWFQELFTAQRFLKATFHLTVSMRGYRATGKIQRNNYHHGNCGSSLTGKTSSVFLIFTHGTRRNVKNHWVRSALTVIKSVQSALSDLKRPPERLQSQCKYRPFIT